MKRLNIIISGLVMFCVFAVPALSVASVSPVFYFTGQVSFFDGKKVQADGMEYLVIEKCVYLKHTRRNKAYYEDKASPNEVQTGDSVILHINGNVVDKIIIEEWKR